MDESPQRQGGAERGSSAAHRDYIADMLAQLADLAAAHEDRSLATTLRLTAVNVERAPERRAGAG